MSSPPFPQAGTAPHSVAPSRATGHIHTRGRELPQQCPACGGAGVHRGGGAQPPMHPTRGVTGVGTPRLDDAPGSQLLCGSVVLGQKPWVKVEAPPPWGCGVPQTGGA